MEYRLETDVLENEYWWGGAAHDGIRMPLDKDSEYSIDLGVNHRGNQAAPFYLSTKGRYIWSEEPFSICFHKGHITVRSQHGEITFFTPTQKGTLKTAYISAMKQHFPFSGVIPERCFYETPQFNTWIELLDNQNEAGIMQYAENILKNGYPSGILMIDDTWQENYGVWEFHHARFPNPGKMCQDLHRMGFRILLWMVPFLSPDSPEFRKAEQIPGCLITDDTGQPVIFRWWNGFSAGIDMRTKAGQDWLRGRLQHLQSVYGIDGFKFDGGDTETYYQKIQDVVTASQLTQAYFRFAEKYEIQEVKDTWKAGGRPFNQRLRDKLHTWEGEGLACLIPDALNASLTGHIFLCPDMVGGGENSCFLPGAPLDEELVVRSAQASALFPMMQFSAAPWRVLSHENAEFVKAMALLHASMGMPIYELVTAAAENGEPLLTPLCYHYPDSGYEKVMDQYMLGKDILVAPVLNPGQTCRDVVLPEGKWEDAKGHVFEGNQTISFPAPLSILPWLRRK